MLHHSLEAMIPERANYSSSKCNVISLWNEVYLPMVQEGKCGLFDFALQKWRDGVLNLAVHQLHLLELVAGHSGFPTIVKSPDL